MKKRLIDPSIIDIEASGFGNASYPIEIGVALNDGARFCTLIMPQPDWTYWDKAAEKVHHITRDMLIASGRPIGEVTAQLNELLKGKTLYSDGWVVDQPWLIKLFYAAGREMKFSISSLDMILSEGQMAIWHQTKAAVIKNTKRNRHRASYDAWVIQETFRLTLKIAAGA